jgi:hypothetical protein
MPARRKPLPRLIFLFIHTNVHTNVLKLFLLALVAALYFLLIGLWLLPLWTKHRLTETHLSLHYGLALKVNIPRSAIIAVQPVREQLTMLEPLMARYDAKKGRIVAAAADQGQVLLHLDKPHALKVGRSTVLADTLLINVDTRNEFLAALGPRGAATVASPSQIGMYTAMITPEEIASAHNPRILFQVQPGSWNLVFRSDGYYTLMTNNHPYGTSYIGEGSYTITANQLISKDGNCWEYVELIVTIALLTNKKLRVAGYGLLALFLATPIALL